MNDSNASKSGRTRANQIAGIIDHTLLKASATKDEIRALCEEADHNGFASVCVNPGNVTAAVGFLKRNKVKVCTVIGFPLGANNSLIKALEARDAIANGAEELDMVINIGALKSGDDKLVLEDIQAVRAATKGKILKVIIETALLNQEEKVKACLMAKQAGADFVKTSTGFAPSGATVEDVQLMRATVGLEMGVKASGGIKDAAFAEALVKAGANRLGTSSGIAIISGSASTASY